ncbi:MAG: SUMF1/EgtB/PvdO family nonheme iron enzyme [Labilithrix sp.]|nr:SUMF1/EgtB/PvdO family nonheme iron enzyme [Labilithrix sp.]
MESSSHKSLRRILIAKAAAFAALSALGVYGAWWLRAQGLTIGEATTELRRGEDPRYDWRSVDKKHWQALSPITRLEGSPPLPSEEASEITDAREANGAGCASGMVRVKGNHRVESLAGATGEIERIQDGACTDWISREFPARCRTFDKEKIAADVAKLPTRPLDFCMDRFEYPNVLGQNPMIVVTFNEAQNLCKKSKKRLCTETEWTFACEGEEVRPYPYGWTRDTTACVVDRSWRPFKEGALAPRDGQKARAELDRLWQAEPSGTRGACKSPFGVYDMTGNVDEWTRSVRPTGYTSILKGGYWGPVRARCRPATRAHNEDFVAYQQGFRCCGDANASVPPPAATPPVAAAPPATEVDAGAPRASELSAEWPDPGPSDDDDELDAIGKARVKLGCASARAPAPASTSPLLVGFAIAAVLRAARRWRKSPTTTISCPSRRSRARARR